MFKVILQAPKNNKLRSHTYIVDAKDSQQARKAAITLFENEQGKDIPYTVSSVTTWGRDDKAT